MDFEVHTRDGMPGTQGTDVISISSDLAFAPDTRTQQPDVVNLEQVHPSWSVKWQIFQVSLI